jgi:hypothetical protein
VFLGFGGAPSEFTAAVDAQEYATVMVQNGDELSYSSSSVDFSKIVVPQQWPRFTPYDSPIGFSTFNLDTSPWNFSGAPRLEVYRTLSDAIAGTNAFVSYDVYADGITNIGISHGPSGSIVPIQFPNALGIMATEAGGDNPWTEDDNFFGSGSGGGGASGSECFVEGTRITLGDLSSKAIEDIKVGDVVRTHDGRNVSVTALYRVAANLDANPAARPVCVPSGERGATANLYVTKRHGLVVSDPSKALGWDLVPAGNLFAPNDAALPPHLLSGTIFYYHLMLPKDTDTLLANGVATESWRNSTVFGWKARVSQFQGEETLI